MKVQGSGFRGSMQKRIANIECRIMNVEGMNSVYLKRRLSNVKPPFDILRFIILRFCGSLFTL